MVSGWIWNEMVRYHVVVDCDVSVGLCHLLVVPGKCKLTWVWHMFFWGFEETHVYLSPTFRATFLSLPRLFPLCQSWFLFLGHPLRILIRKLSWLATVVALCLFGGSLFWLSLLRLCKSRFAFDASESGRMDSLNVVARNLLDQPAINAAQGVYLRSPISLNPHRSVHTLCTLKYRSGSCFGNGQAR